MTSGHGKVSARAIDAVSVSFAFSPGHRDCAGRDEFVERDAVPILGHIRALSLADLHQVTFDAGKGNLLSGSARDRQRTVLQVHEKKAEAESGGYGQETENTHGGIVVP